MPDTPDMLFANVDLPLRRGTGGKSVDAKAEVVRRLHDDACRAHSELPLA
jgi:hypothetical protein